MACAAAPSSKASDPDDKINIWEGRWKEVVETKETPYSHAHSLPTHLTCAWTADRGYMVCEYLSEKANPDGSRPSDHLSIFTYDEKSKTYKHLGISKDYKTLEETATIDGNRWHYNYELPDENGKKLLLLIPTSLSLRKSGSRASRSPQMTARIGRCCQKLLGQKFTDFATLAWGGWHTLPCARTIRIDGCFVSNNSLRS